VDRWAAPRSPGDWGLIAFGSGSTFRAQAHSSAIRNDASSEVRMRKRGALSLIAAGGLLAGRASLSRQPGANAEPFGYASSARCRNVTCQGRWPRHSGHSRRAGTRSRGDAGRRARLLWEPWRQHQGQQELPEHLRSRIWPDAGQPRTRHGSRSTRTTPSSSSRRTTTIAGAMAPVVCPTPTMAVHAWADATAPTGFVRGDAVGSRREYFQSSGDTSVAWDTRGKRLPVMPGVQARQRGLPGRRPVQRLLRLPLDRVRRGVFQLHRPSRGRTQ